MNFRRWITALAVLTLFAGLAAAQTSGTGGGAVMTCSTVAQVTPTIRSEGITELVGDIVITCAGGTAVPTGTAIPAGNIVVSLTAPVTSRLGSAATGAEGTPSEAILLVDEPNSGLTPVVAGFGPAAPLSVCPLAGGTGCVEYAQVVGGVPVASGSTTSAVATYNVFQGNYIPGGSTVSFQGVPFLPPIVAGTVRVYRITNIRVDARNAGASLVGGFGVIQAQISTNGQSTLAVSQPVVTIAYVATSLTTSVTAASTKYQQCNASNGAVATLNFIEQFPSAFKTRVAPIGTAAGTGFYSSYVGTTSAAWYMQNTPGQLYNSESGFILPVNGLQAGLADFGTRFKAVFANLPTGATIYVSQLNTNAGTGVSGYYNAPQPSIATYTTGESSGFANPSSTTTVASTTVVPLSVSSGAATAVWEVINTNTSQNETYSFGVYIAYNAGAPSLTATATTPPASGAPQVTLTYAPITSTTSIPRFIAGPGTAPAGLINVIACQTLLLFPYVTSTSGFDTGLAISNTSMDPIGTTTSTGACTLNWYGTNAPTTPPSTGTIAPGTLWANAASFYVPYTGGNTGFTGYVFATCFFQNAHGFAFVSDFGARNLAMGYLALIVNNGVSLTNRNGPPSGEALNN